MLAEPRFVDPNETVEEAWRALQDDTAGGWLVGTREHLVGVISRDQLEGAITLADVTRFVGKGRRRSVAGD
jgi:CBS domain-containing protein